MHIIMDVRTVRLAVEFLTSIERSLFSSRNPEG